MGAPKVGGLRTTTDRDAAQDPGIVPDLTVPERLNKQYKHVFQSRKSDFVISLARRRVHYLADGSKEELAPETAAGSRLDMVRFKDHFFRTNDDELAEAFKKQPSHVFGIEGYCWRYEDQVQIQREARAAEIRAALAADPELQKQVALTPSDKKDWDLAQKPAVTRPAKAIEELTQEELEAQTAPPPGSRTR